MVQLLFRAGAPSATLTLSCCGDECVQSVKQRLSEHYPQLGSAASMVFTRGGRLLQDDRCLSAYFLRSGNTVHVSNRLRGGGGDGGSTGAESRSCYLEMYQQRKPDKVNPAEELLAKWTRCHLSGAELQPPCVIDELGVLYNKDALLEALISKTLPAALSYITGMKAVTQLKFAANPNYNPNQPKAAAKGSHQPGNEAAFHCPITGQEFNGRFKFLVHRPTGTVLSEKAVKEVPAVVAETLGVKPTAEDWIPVNPTGDQLEALKQKQAAKMAAEREKKAKKAAAKLAAVTAANNELSNGDNGNGVMNGNGKQRSPDSPDDLNHAGQKRSSPPQNSGTGTASRVIAEEGIAEPPFKKSKALSKNGTSSVYASIFTSSLKEAPKETYMCRSTSARGMHLT